MNKQDKDMIDGFLTRTEPKPKKKYNKRLQVEKLTKEEQRAMDRAFMRDMVIDCVVLAIVMILTVAALAWIVGKVNGANC